jgi:hypothetical protein
MIPKRTFPGTAFKQEGPHRSGTGHLSARMQGHQNDRGAELATPDKKYAGMHTHTGPLLAVAVRPVALDSATGQLPEPMILTVVSMGVPPSCLGQRANQQLDAVLAHWYRRRQAHVARVFWI